MQDHAEATLAAELPEIPLIEALGPTPSLEMMADEGARLDHLVETARAHYGRGFIATADRLSRRWVTRNSSPYGEEIAEIANRMPAPGGWFLNASFEWGCTAGLARDPDTGAFTLLRVLDWPLPGLGRTLVAAQQRGPAGEFLNLTWPGFAGAVTAVAAGRFAAALNQAPMPLRGLGKYGDWTVERFRVWRSRELPPMHLLRQVFERCQNYEDARLALSHTPIAIPAIYVLTGARPGEGCVIERMPHAARLHDAPVCVANQWLSSDLKGRDRGTRSGDRLAVMRALTAEAPPWDFDWLAEPMLNRTTRLAAVLDPAGGRVLARGYEDDGPATQTLHLAA
ncbi:MAG: hypothetical protein V3R85_10250 [Alphaproteobacteria bacterium]